MANRRAVPITSDESITWLDQDSKVGGLGLDFDEVPAMLGDVAGAEWARLGVVFADQPTRFREGDRSIVVAYCLAWSIYLMATAELASDIWPVSLACRRTPAGVWASRILPSLRMTGSGRERPCAACSSRHGTL
jgi:phage terminase small subunit